MLEFTNDSLNHDDDDGGSNHGSNEEDSNDETPSREKSLRGDVFTISSSSLAPAKDVPSILKQP